MSDVVLLDTGILGLVTNPRGGERSRACNQWLETVLQRGARVVVPEIADYELRRELLRARMEKGLERLNELVGTLSYQPLTTNIMRQAAANWATVRNRGQPTADASALDGDAILAAQAMACGDAATVVIATDNVGHLSRFDGINARGWDEVTA
ncbi:MAG: hypothetical protein HYY96_03105 [Candidatus Tectomicrobia bacterium]|nr:hypothetical protein [Candidatus Tectomicrobia bacterium]